MAIAFIISNDRFYYQERSLLPNLVINKAKNWGFICHYQKSSYWQILPQLNQRWILQQSEEQWILIVGDVPQLRLHTEEAIAFLMQRVAGAGYIPATRCTIF